MTLFWCSWSTTLPHSQDEFFASSTILVTLSFSNFAFQLVKGNLFFKCNWQLVHPWNENVKMKVNPRESHPNIKIQRKLNLEFRC